MAYIILTAIAIVGLLIIFMEFKNAPTIIDYSLLEFKPNQKVYIRNTHEENDNYIGPGIIISFAYKRESYWTFSHRPENWFKIKTANGEIIYRGLGRITDLREFIEKEKKWFNASHVKKWKEERFQESSRLILEDRLKKAEDFLNN